MISVYTVLAHPIYQLGIKSAIEQSVNYKLIGENNDKIFCVNEINHLKPNILLLDIDLSLSDLVDINKSVNAEINVVLMVYSFSVVKLFNIKKIKYEALISKYTSIEHLFDCFEKVMVSRKFIDKNLKLLQSSLNNLKKITKSEAVIFEMIIQNKSTSTIANKLNVSPKTIENHRANICRKLNISGVNAISNFILKHYLTS
jgi:NarL family two-component system response regulator LiaR